MLYRKDRVKDTLSFWDLLKINGIIPITFGYYAFYFAIVTSVVSYFLLEDMCNNDLTSIYNFVGTTFAPVSAALMGIIIAGLSIMVAFTNGKLLHLLLINQNLQRILFPFWLVAIVWGLSTLLSIVIYVLQFILPNDYTIILTCIEFGILVYAIFDTIKLVGDTIHAILLFGELIPEDSMKN